MTKPPIVMLVHGGPQSIEAVRARGLSQAYPSDRLHLLYREGSRWQTAKVWKERIRELRPGLLYVINTALPGAVLAPRLAKKTGLPFILDTGDAVFAMAKSAGIAPLWKLPLLGAAESIAQREAAAIVVRGTRHAEFLKKEGFKRVHLIRDGIDTGRSVSEAKVCELRKRLGLEGVFVSGVMGSLVYSPKLGICYGWDLIEALGQLRDLPIRGMIIGDGDGRAKLEERARALGVLDRIVFTGRIPYDDVPAYLRLMDVAISTQTNNLAGQVRTTGKLPEYMAAGCFVLASRVGEAELVLPEAMLLDYAGEVDSSYPQRMAGRLRELQSNPSMLEIRRTLPSKAEELFSYRVLSERFNQIVAEVLATRGG